MNYFGISPLYMILMPLMTTIGAVLGAFANGWMQRRASSGTVAHSNASELWSKSDRLEDKLILLHDSNIKRIDKLELDFAKSREEFYTVMQEKETFRIKISQLEYEVSVLKAKIRQLGGTIE